MKKNLNFSLLFYDNLNEPLFEFYLNYNILICLNIKIVSYQQDRFIRFMILYSYLKST